MSKLHLIHSKNAIDNESIEQTILEFIAGLAKGTRPGYLSIWKHYREWQTKNHPDKTLLDIKHLHIQIYFQIYEKRKGFSRDNTDNTISAATLKKISSALVAIFDAVKTHHELGLFNPFKKEFDKYKKKANRSKQRRPTKLTPLHIVKQLIETPDASTKIGRRDRAILAALYGGGLRRSELLKIRLRDVNISENQVEMFLSDTKNGSDVDQVIAPQMTGAIINYYNQRVAETSDLSAYFFIDYRGCRNSPQEHKPLSASSVYLVFKYYCAVLGLPKDLSPHSARSTAITALLDKNLSHREIQSFSRHSSIQMVEAYDKKRGDKSMNPAKFLEFE